MHVWWVILGKIKLLTFSSLSATLALYSFKKASLWCVTSSSCAGPRTATCPTPKKPSWAFWLRSTTGRGSVERGAPSSTACESTYVHRHHTYACFYWPILISAFLDLMWCPTFCYCFEFWIQHLLMNFILVWMEKLSDSTEGLNFEFLFQVDFDLIRRHTAFILFTSLPHLPWSHLRKFVCFSELLNLINSELQRKNESLSVCVFTLPAWVEVPAFH